MIFIVAERWVSLHTAHFADKSGAACSLCSGLALVPPNGTRSESFMSSYESHIRIQ